MQQGKPKEFWGAQFGLTDPTALSFPQPPTCSPPSCPTFESLTSQAVAVADVPKPRGIFWDLFGGQPEPLLQDVIEHEDRYSIEMVALANDLVHQRKKLSELTPGEASLLNAGAVSFYEYRPAVIPTPKTPVVRPPRSLVDEPVTPPERPTAGVDIPTGVDPNPYWWV